MSGGFQTQVYNTQAQAVAGDFASSNQWFTFDAGPGGLVSGAAGVTIGRFAWVTPPLDANGTTQVVNSFGSGPVAGFVHRAQQGLNPTFLSNAGNLILQGFAMTLLIDADLWVTNAGSTTAQPGQKAYANFTNGSASFAATATPAAGGSATGDIAAATNAFTGSIDGDVLTVTAVGSGNLVPGTVVAGSGVASGTQILSQISGTALGVGTYYVSIGGQSIASEAMTGSYGIFTAASALTGTFAVGQVLSGSGGGGVTAGTTITALGTGTGGLGTYYVQTTQTVTSSTITSVSNVETKWYARSIGAPGALVKISATPLG